MRVWRVGHATARDNGFPSGPYTCVGIAPESAEDLWGMADAHRTSTHPSPLTDPRLGGIAHSERCGFDSLRALRTWFDGWTDTLVDAGFQIHIYEVPDCAVRFGGRGQVVFRASKAVEIERRLLKPVQLALFEMETSA